MTNEEIIVKLLKENLKMKETLEECFEYASSITGKLFCIGGGLNDNIKNYTQDQMKDLIFIASSAKAIIYKTSGEL